MSLVNIEPISDWRMKNHAIGWVFLSLYTFLWLISFDSSRTAEVLFILCFSVAWFSSADKSQKWHKVFLLLALFVVLQFFVYFFAVDRFPEFASQQVKASRHLAKPFLCIAVAWWLRGSVNSAKYLLSLLLVGFLVSLLINSTIAEWLAGFKGKRVDFGYTNAQHTALFFGLTLILGLCWFASNIYRQARLLKLFLPALTITLGLAGVVVTQTRAVWLGLAVVAAVSIVAVTISLIKTKGVMLRRKRILLPTIFIGFMLFFSVVEMKPIVQQRLAAEQSVIQSLEKGDLANIPMSSIGIRVHTWVYALEKISERPLTGWGGESRKPLIDEGPFEPWIKEKYGHFHNAYIEIWLAYGALGFIAYGLLTAIIITGYIRLVRSGHFIFGYGLLSAWLFFFVVNIFESYLIFNSGIYFYIVVGGVGMSSYLFGAQSRAKERAW